MKNKGFTLIELLAVIVILAIIALIATPIIIGIIKDAKEESDERSVELYASAIKNALANHQLLGNNPISGTGYTSDSLEAVLDVDYDGDVDCSLIDITTDGKVTMLGCKVNGDTKEYSYGIEKATLVKFDEVCTPVTKSTLGNVPSGNYTKGDEYLCKVDPNKPSYTFFVLSKEGNKVNLIMSENLLSNVVWQTNDEYIALGGKITDEMLNDGGACEFGGECYTVEYGPTTAMAELNNATSDWTKTSNIVEIYNDDYIKNFKVLGRARMPYKKEVIDAGCQLFVNNSCPSWLDGSYWTMSSGNHYIYVVNVVYGGGYDEGGARGTNGIRPVITLEI